MNLIIFLVIILFNITNVYSECQGYNINNGLSFYIERYFDGSCEIVHKIVGPFYIDKFGNRTNHLSYKNGYKYVRPVEYTIYDDVCQKYNTRYYYRIINITRYSDGSCKIINDKNIIMYVNKFGNESLQFNLDPYVLTQPYTVYVDRCGKYKTYVSFGDASYVITKYSDGSCEIIDERLGTIYLDKFGNESFFNGYNIESTNYEFLYFDNNNTTKSNITTLFDTNKYIFNNQLFVLDINKSNIFDISIIEKNNIITINNNRLYYLYLHMRGEISKELLKYVTNHTYGIYINGQEVISCQTAITPYTTNSSYDIIENNNINSTLHFLPCSGVAILNLKEKDKIYFGFHLKNEIPNKVSLLDGLYNYWGISDY